MRRILFLSALLASIVFTAWGQTNYPPAKAHDPNDSLLFSFGVLADCQYCECPTTGTRFYIQSKDKLREATQVFNAQPLSFVVSLGDLINSGKESYDTLIPILRTLRHPFYVVYGNHDFIGDRKADRAIMLQWGLRKRYYSFQRPGWRFIILDSNDISLSSGAEGSRRWAEGASYLDNLKSLAAQNTSSYNGALSSAQLNWLKKELDEALLSDQRVLVMNHMPIFPAGASINLWNDQEVEKILKKSPQVMAYFCGHHHKGNYFWSDGIHYLNFQGMVETDQNSFALIHVYQRGIRVEGFGREESRSLFLGNLKENKLE